MDMSWVFLQPQTKYQVSLFLCFFVIKTDCSQLCHTKSIILNRYFIYSHILSKHLIKFKKWNYQVAKIKKLVFDNPLN
jgi:hypothetical protein